MSDTREPADEQQIVEPTEAAGPAIDAAGMGQETGEVPAELDDDDTSAPSPDLV
ncbi:hypothetical protein ABC304_06040 [Microbacterium sp. 1P10UB]|uniref:hypothetical protein n=1 Tax=unclassified Microbacterium TaxID=2609290 RepID=UPI0039A1EBCE